MMMMMMTMMMNYAMKNAHAVPLASTRQHKRRPDERACDRSRTNRGEPELQFSTHM